MSVPDAGGMPLLCSRKAGTMNAKMATAKIANATIPITTRVEVRADGIGSSGKAGSRRRCLTRTEDGSERRARSVLDR
jgi:hypothetical protein